MPQHSARVRRRLGALKGKRKGAPHLLARGRLGRAWRPAAGGCRHSGGCVCAHVGDPRPLPPAASFLFPSPRRRRRVSRLHSRGRRRCRRAAAGKASLPRRRRMGLRPRHRRADGAVRRLYHRRPSWCGGSCCEVCGGTLRERRGCAARVVVPAAAADGHEMGPVIVATLAALIAESCGNGGRSPQVVFWLLTARRPCSLRARTFLGARWSSGRLGCARTRPRERGYSSLATAPAAKAVVPSCGGAARTAEIVIPQVPFGTSSTAPSTFPLH